MASNDQRLRIVEATDYVVDLANGTQLIAVAVSHGCRAKPYFAEILIMQSRIAQLRCNRDVGKTQLTLFHKEQHEQQV